MIILSYCHFVHEIFNAGATLVSDAPGGLKGIKCRESPPCNIRNQHNIVSWYNVNWCKDELDIHILKRNIIIQLRRKVQLTLYSSRIRAI
jgi:hypothetical protein